MLSNSNVIKDFLPFQFFIHRLTKTPRVTSMDNINRGDVAGMSFDAARIQTSKSIMLGISIFVFILIG